MVRVGILRLADCESCGFSSAQGLPDPVKERIEKTKNTTEKKLRTAAYLLLDKMYRDAFFDAEMPEIVYTPQGKPQFAEHNSCHFNISHDKDAVAVAISFCEVGIDIERCDVSVDSAARISKRYAEAFEAVKENGNREPEVMLSFFTVRDGEIYKLETPLHISEASEADFSSRWTRLEAILKLDGGGFASIGSIKEMAKKTANKTVTVELGGQKFALTVAEKA